MDRLQRSRPLKMDALLRTKLAPPCLHRDLVPRPQLLVCLDEGTANKLTLISAPPGFGKTTLVSEWITARDEPTAWVSLDTGDNDPIRFWRYVV